MTTTERPLARKFRLTVLNPVGRDPAQDFSSGQQNSVDAKKHAPVNFHAYAACTGGVFHRDTKSAIAEGLPVLLLLRGDFRESERALVELQRRGLTVVVSLKETGLHQIAKQLSNPKRAARFRAIVQAADGCLAATSEAPASYPNGEFIPTPYPLHDPAWDFGRSLGERRGIFVGTREWDVPSRHHLTAVILALQLGEPVTIFDQDKGRTKKIFSALGLPVEALRVLRKRLPYRDYLAEVSRHRIVVQADRSAVPGQVAGDALLCRMPCVGGDGAIDRIAFPATCGFGRSLGELSEIARRLLHDNSFYAANVAESQKQARAKLAFEVVAQQLAQFFARVALQPERASASK